MSGAIRVLVVEDDAVLAQAHQMLLGRIPGFEAVGVAHTGAAALAFLGAHEVDLVLLDVFLPDMGGLDVCRRLRQQGRSVDVVAVTSARDVELVRSAVSLGVVQYLLKPFTFALFREKLERYAEYRQALGASQQQVAAQQDVDRLYATLRGSSTAGLPKGIGRDTWERVLEAVRASSGDVSASEVADRLGLSRVTARRYLEHMTEQQLAARTLRYGRAGRPEQRYRWAR